MCVCVIYVYVIHLFLLVEAHLFLAPPCCVAWLWPSFLQENVEVLGPGDLVQLVDLRMTDLNGEQGYILRLVPGHKEERVEVPLGKPYGKPYGS